jgi:Isocitrate/isopropylmalate dehydrogenase
MLDWLGQPAGATLIRRAVEAVCADPANWTADLGGKLTTAQSGDAIVAKLIGA